MSKSEVNLKDFSEEIRSPRIVLRRLNATFENAEKVFSTIDENREYLSEWLDWVSYSQKPEDTYNHFKECEEKLQSNTNVTYDIFLDDAHIGRVSCFGKDIEDGIGEIGYFLSEKYAGKGYMTEAVMLLEKELFSRGMIRICIKCDVENLKSSSVAKRAGYKFEALLHKDCYMNNRTSYRDTEIYYKLNPSYEG